MGKRVIFHIDCNSFYASVELLRHPELRGVPVAVSGSVDERHGIILAKNEAAKKFKVQTAETVWQAKRKCPNLVLLPPHRKEYNKYYTILNEMYGQYTDRVEPFGIDESWLDMTGTWQLFGDSPRAVADMIRRRVTQETGLTVSIGISFNKVFAKLGSDYKKPDAVTEINKENYKEIVWPLPVTALLFVGNKAKETLQKLSIKTIGDIAAEEPDVLYGVLGKQGRQLSTYARGEDASPVLQSGQQEQAKSIGNGLTFRRNLVGEKDIKLGVYALADEVATRLRQQKLYAAGVQILIKNPELKSISRQKQLTYATNLARDLGAAAMELMRQHWNFAKPIRMLTLTAQNLSDMPFAVQTSMLEQNTGINPKIQSLEKSVDKIREKYGRTAILSAGGIHNDIGVDALAKPSRAEEEPEE